MELAENGIASGSIWDLPPSKRFKFINSDPISAPCLPLPAKKRVFAPPPAVAVPLCLPAKKRAILSPPSKDAIPVCLPAKKRAYAPQVDAVTEPACLPAKKRPYAPPPPSDSVAWHCVPTKKRVHEREISACSPPVRVLAKSRVDGRPSRKDAAGTIPVCPPAKNRVHERPPQKHAAGPVSVPLCPPAKNRVHGRPSRKDAAGPVPVCPPAKEHVHAPSPRADGAGLVPVCLPTNKRVMPPLPSPSVQSDGGRLGSVKDVEPQGSIKHSAAASKHKLANGTEGGAREKEAKKSEKPIDPKELKEFVPVKPSKPRSPKKAQDLEKKDCKVPDVRSCKVEVCEKDVESIDAKQAARKEELRNSADDEAGREQEQGAEEEQDDGVLCAVCRSTDGEPSDPIVFCDGCDLMVHASCYGNPLAQAIPDGDWFCSLCSANKSKAAVRPRCCLCPAKGGAMKRTKEGQWAHIACALLVPEVFFRDPDGRDGVDCSRVPAHRFTKGCYICETSNGCALECSQPKCGRGFHVSCGLDGGLCIEYQEGKRGAIVAGFCREHTELWEKQQLTGKYKIVARGQE